MRIIQINKNETAEINRDTYSNRTIANINRDRTKTIRGGKKTNVSSTPHPIPTSKNQNSLDSKYSKDKTYQSTSQDLLDSSSETTGFAHATPIENNHYELQKQISLSSTFNLRSNTSF